MKPTILLPIAILVAGSLVAGVSAQDDAPESWHGESTLLAAMPDPPPGYWSVATIVSHCIKMNEIAFCDDPRVWEGVTTLPILTPEDEK